MSAPNFKTMTDFPLYVSESHYCKVCPECGLTNDAEADTCECGHTLADVESVYDEIMDEDTAREMQDAADEMNSIQPFYKVSVESGYYTGMQFYVEDKYDDLENWDNDDAQYEFGMCRSKMLRAYNSALNKVRKMLKKSAREIGLTELACLGVFSNGEAVYRRVDAA